LARIEITSGQISGHVVDPSGANIVGATVQLLNVQTGEVREAKTAESGDFVFPAVQPGQFKVRIALIGFKAYEKENLNLSANERLSAGNITLAVGAQSETVEVQADRTPVQTESGERSALLDSKELSTLMTAGRDVTALLRVLPGVVKDGGGASQRILPVGGHNRRARTAADHRIAAPAPVFFHQSRSALRVAARRQGRRAEQQFDLALGADGQQPEPEPPAKRAKTAIVLAALAARRHPRRQPHLVASRGAIDALQDQFEIELQFQFADDHHRWLTVAQRDDIAIADFALDREFQALEKPLHRDVERRFLHGAGIADSSPDGIGIAERPMSR